MKRRTYIDIEFSNFPSRTTAVSPIRIYLGPFKNWSNRVKDAFDRSFPPVLFYMSYLQIINRDDKCTVLFVGRRCIVFQISGFLENGMKLAT